MKDYIIRLLFKVDASGLKKQLQSISKEAARVGAAMAKSMNRAFKTVAKQGGDASKQVVKSLDNIDKKASQSAKKVGDISSKFSDLGKTLVSGLLGVGAASAINSTIKSFASLEVGLQKLQAAANLFGKDFNTIKNDLIEIRKEGVLSFETLNYTARQLLTPAFNMAEKDVGRFIEALRNIAATEGIYEDLDFAITSFVRGLQTGTAELLENLSPRIRAFIQTDAGGFAKVQKDQAARQKLFNEILESGAKAQEDYERLLGTTEFTTRKLNQSVLELRESIGEGLAPVFNELVTTLTGLTRGFTGLIETMTISQKSGVLVGTIFTALGFILTPLIVKVGGLTAAMAGLGATLAAFAPTLGIIAALGVGLGVLTSKFVESKQSLASLASEASKTASSIAKLEKEISSTKRLTDERELLKLKQKQFELEGKIVDKIKSQVLSTVELRSAVRLLGAEGVKVLQQNLIAEREVLRKKAERFFDVEGPATPFGRTRRGEFERFIGKEGVAALEKALTTGGQADIDLARGFIDKRFAGKGRQPEGLAFTLRQISLLLQQMSGTQAGINQAQRQIIGITDPAGGGGGGAVMGAGGSPLSMRQRLGLTLANQLIEIERSFNKSKEALQEFRKKALDPSTEEYKNLSRTLEGTGISNRRYLNKLEYELNIKTQLARNTAIVNDRFKELNKDLKETDESIARLSTTAGLVDSFSSALEELDGTLGGLLKSISGISGGISEVLKDLAESRRKSIDEGIKSGDIKSEDIDDFINSVATTKIIGAFIERFSLGVGIFGGVLSGLTSIFSSDVFAAPADDRLFIETIEIKDVGLKQLEILERQYELQRQLAEVESDYYQNNLKALDLIEQKTGVSQAQQRFDLAIAELARLQSGASVAQFERLSESERERLIEQARGVATQEGFESQIKNVKDIGIAAVGSQALLDELSKESPDLFKVFDLFTPELIERFPEIYDYIKRVRTARLTGTTIDDGSVGGVGGGGQVTLTPGFFNPGGAGPTTGTTQVIETTDGGTQSLLQAFFGSLSEGLLELQNVNDNSNQILNAINSAITYNNELTKKVADNTLQQVQARGFGAVDVSRGGLAFGRDFIPTAASLISNVGVPAQIGSLSVAAEANKTMDQKMLDSLQNQLIELKAQTNLLAQLTNTDARIVIANAQQAVKATGF